MSIETLEYDVIGLGFGPANLAIAVALDEDRRVREHGLRYCFLEKKPAFEWHGGMLLDDSRMQISFLKDLATLRNPSSRYTFVSYLHEKRRLEAFINISTFTPSRLEYNDYLGWAAAQFSDRVHYGEEVIGVEPVLDGGDVTRVKVISRLADGRTRARITRNLVVSIGGEPVVPEAFRPLKGDARVMHSSGYLERIQACGQPKRLAVVGSGQSAAEIFSDLCGRYPSAEVSLVMRSQALRPADDSPFINEIFDPSYTDVVYGQSPEEREAFIQANAQTNYSVVNLDLIESIYHRLYLQKVTGHAPHNLLPQRNIEAVQAGDEGIRLTLSGPEGVEDRLYDAVVLATGYRRDGYKRLLGGLAEHLGEGVERDYRLCCQPQMTAGIYLQGCCEASHGLSDTLLSVLAIRSQEVVDALMDSRRQRQSAGVASACA
ncbi:MULTISPECIES: lysine N(6)-hydroxylase/L-ornithine N(5)-oxygenase family protein [unclassified Pseudomonas]|uniref:lysine N(6)-hydroxylase/L-ornithine N(5)-oxygenase family protein n=1 Tax=unclassified Pseudomonas TaxID=196821 RepID=UPI0024488691|nr:MULTISPECIES: lysine N(6)-hydroxylase/L-ornithine N(5)-oxygenase family protein [unclassified Pseudomonas]MDG9922897.1 lysine N(6)-hydroxylase/L-ornithine N(5)-oxygenase family protein [Pseudomonas sp. GD04045]MDH0035739.1 lysine N(6)-hydroxylase/L-ornithine N(5)-oxygenase family protein [Pseudomonas sp. GD04019]